MLTKHFYQTTTVKVAKNLLGKTLIFESGTTVFKGEIVETEAYLGLTDPACHSFHGKRTNRILSMYLDAGHSYVYLIYGMYHCLNVVTGSEDEPEAVLIRALSLTEHSRAPEKKIASGPGRLCRTLGINKEHDGLLLYSPSSPLRIHEGRTIEEENISATARIGINPRLNAHDWPLRFFIKGHPEVSKGKFPPSGEMPAAPALPTKS